MTNIGLLGAGRIGRIHGMNVAAHATAKLIAVADAVASAAASLARDSGAKAMDAKAMIADKSIDALMICSPTDTHADLIEDGVRAGKAVFCEKPVDLNSDRIRKCLEIVTKAGKPVMIGFNRRFDPHFAALKRRLKDGAIGKVELVTIISRDPGPPPVEYIKRSGGLFRDMMIHDLDMVCFLLEDQPVEISAVGSSIVDPAIGQAGDVDTAAVIMKTASGKIAQISNSRRASYGYDQRIEVHGSGGLLRAGNVHETTVELADDRGFRSDPIQNFFLERYAAAYRAELDAFLAVCAGGPPSPSVEDGLKAQVLADAATRSAQTGETVKLQ